MQLEHSRSRAGDEIRTGNNSDVCSTRGPSVRMCDDAAVQAIVIFIRLTVKLD